MDESKQPEHELTHIAPKLRTDTLAASVTILLAMTVAQRAIGFVRSILICRWLEPEEVGQWDMAFSFLMLAAPLAVLAIPACFGRYTEYYRQRGQLKTLIKRTGLVSIGSTLIAALIVLTFRDWFSNQIFGVPDKGDIVGLLAIALVISVSTHYFIELLNALRLIRILGVLQFMNSFTFAVFCVVLVLGWQTTAVSIIVAYAISCLIGTIGVFLRLAPSWKDLEVSETRPTQSEFWQKIAPYVLWITITSLMSNLFTVADRYMIIHYSNRFDQTEALQTVGVYFSSRIIPALIVSVAIMLANVVLPHLSHDWELGRHDRVKMRLNLFMKLLTPFLTAGGIAVLIASPLIFDWALDGKYNDGLQILPMTLAYCIWSGMISVVTGYLLCAEKAKLGSLALVVGLVVNVTLNLILLPRYGLEGAVIATTIANVVALAVVVLFNFLFGFRNDYVTLLMLATPVLLFAFHPLIAAAILVVVMIALWLTGQLFNADERTVLAETIDRFLARLK
ncbi:MAG: oligosaccharide flippase family protein [Planctomycetia bacterium]